MTANKTHSPDKHVLQQKIEAIRQLADKSADTGDFDELLRYFPHPWFTSVAEWAFIVQLIETAEQNLKTSLAARQGVLAGARAIAEAAGKQVAPAAVKAPQRAAG